MKVILGLRAIDYNIQTNDKRNPVSDCGLNAIVNSLSVTGHDLSKIKKVYQVPDEYEQHPDQLEYVCSQQNRFTEFAKAIVEIRGRGNWGDFYDEFIKGKSKPYHYPEMLYYLINSIYPGKAEYPRWASNWFDVYKSEIDKGNSFVICGNWTTEKHYVSIVGYEEPSIIYVNDSAPYLYKNNDGYNVKYISKNLNKLEPITELANGKKTIFLDSYQLLVKKA